MRPPGFEPGFPERWNIPSRSGLEGQHPTARL